MKFRNPWIDPRIVQMRIEQVQAYLSLRGWKCLGPAGDLHLLRYERADGNENAPTLFLPRIVDEGPGLQWLIEVVEEIARFEERWATEVVGDMLRLTNADHRAGP
jgi:hypothetical protein